MFPEVLSEDDIDLMEIYSCCLLKTDNIRFTCKRIWKQIASSVRKFQSPFSVFKYFTFGTECISMDH